MKHIKISIAIAPGEERDMMLAMLAGAGFEGFEEGDDELCAYLPEEHYEESNLLAILSPMGVAFTKEEIEPRNWNEEWEAGIQPVVVDGFCTVRAHFNTDPVNTPYCVVITPKMSFGTGHHATTQLMMMAMRHIPFAGKSVFDFGTGTGVLAILACMLGAERVTAIDNDEWAVTNTAENIERNDVTGITAFQGSIEDVEGPFDVILANINRHILLEYMDRLYANLGNNGILLMSGLLPDDGPVISEAAKDCGLLVTAVNERNGWISVQTTRR